MKNKPLLILMVGLSGSGKSTKAKELAEKYNAKIVSSDEIRYEFFGTEYNRANNTKVFNILHKRVRHLLGGGLNVIVDATNLTMKSRRQFMTYDAIRVAYIMRTPFTECWQRDIKRGKSGSVGMDVVISQRKSFQVPFYQEGFNYILMSDSDVVCQNEHIYIDLLDMMKGFDQNNPHHKYDLYNHSVRCDHEIDKADGTLIDCLVGDFHDIGKLFTQETNTETGISTYYSHHNVGAYYLLSNDDFVSYTTETFSKATLLYIITMVNYHMLPFQWKEEKTKEKYKKIFGDYLYDNLTRFNKCDIIASGSEEESRL